MSNLVSADARALAKAVLAGDAAAADALVDFANESRNCNGYSLRAYVDRLEDCIRDCRRTVNTAYRCRSSGGHHDSVVVDKNGDHRLLLPGEVAKLNTLCFSLEWEAANLGRSGIR